MSVVTASTRYQTRSILIGAAVLLSLGMGLRQSLGLFLPPVTRDLALTAADFTLAIAVQLRWADICGASPNQQP
jgi:hypothetical protein